MLDWLKLVQAIGRRVWGPRKLKWSIKHPVELVELVGVLLNRSLELKTETKLIFKMPIFVSILQEKQCSGQFFVSFLGMVSLRDPNSKVNRDLQRLGIKLGPFESPRRSWSHHMSDDLNLGWRILLVSGHRMPKPCKAMGNLKSDTPS